MPANGLPKEELVRSVLDRVLASESFRKADTARRFLKHLVETTLAGRGAELKESTLALDVFERSSDFDQRTDPVVRVQATRLRKRLEQYYSAEGAADPVRFELPKVGYAVVIRDSAAPVPAANLPVPPRRSWRTIAFAAAIVFTAVLAFYLFVNAGPREARFPRSALLASDPGHLMHPALSADGKQLAFVWDAGGNYDIYVKKVGEDTPRRLTTDEAQDLNPSWSPDGRQIVFLRMSRERREIFIARADGTGERKVAEIHPFSVPWVAEASIMRRTPGPAWSPDGQYIVVSDRCADTGPSIDCIYLLSVDGLQRRRVTSGATIGDYSPAFSPDGKRIAFLRTVTDNGITDVYEVSVNGGAERRVTKDGREITSVAWSRDHRLEFISDRGGTAALWSVAESGGEPQPLTGIGRPFYFVSAAARANRAVTIQYFRNSNIWLKNLRDPNSRPAMVVGSSGTNTSAQFSPDGRDIVFISDRSGGPEIWMVKADGSGPHRLTVARTSRLVGSPNWSPDGKQLVFDCAIGGYSQVFVMDRDGANQRQLTSDNWDDMMPSWSHDGQWIYYIARRYAARSLWKVPTAGGAPALVRDGVFSDAMESPDGHIYYSKGTTSIAPGIWEASLSGGERLIPQLADVVHSRHFFVSVRGIYFVPSKRPPWDVLFFDPKTGLVTKAATIEKELEFGTHSLSVSPDGDWLLYTQVDQVGSQIFLLE